MLKNGQFWTLSIIGAVALLLAVANMFLFAQNRALQTEAAGRSQYIQQSVQLQDLYRRLVQELGERALRTRDDQIRDLLASQGINVNFDAAPAAPGAAP